MNKRYFHFGLFKEGVRQTKLIGLLGMIVTLAFTALIWLAILVSELKYSGSSPVLYNFYEIGAVLIAQYCLFSPIMVLFLFRYLNRRDSSDFYHAIPHSREALHISYFCAVEFWNVVTTLATAALVLILYGSVPMMVINTETVAPFLVNMIGAQLLVAASVLFAMSITGTAFTNISVALLVIFVPRILLTAISNMIETHCVIVDIAQQQPFLDPSLNVAAGLPISAFLSVTSGESEQLIACLTDVKNGVYTLALGLVITAAALVMLHFRKSETATKSSPSRLLQAVYRITFGTVLGLVPVYVLFDAILWGDTDNTELWIAVVALVLGIALFYFLFELIATKKAKNLVRAIPGLFIFLLIDGVILASSFGIGNAILTFSPTADELVSISLSEDDDNYFVSKSASVQLTDNQSKDIVAQALADTIQHAKVKTIRRSGTYFYGEITDQDLHSLKVGFETDSGRQYRYVLVDADNYQRLVDVLQGQEDYKKCFYDLPDPERDPCTLNIWAGFLHHPDFTREEDLALYQTFVKEAATLPFDQWYPYAVTAHQGSIPGLGTIFLEIAENNERYFLHFGITEDRFPETTKLYVDYYNAYCPNAVAEVASLLTTASSSGKLYEDYDVSFSVVDPIEWYLEIDSTKLVSKAEEILAAAKPYRVGTDDLVLSLSVYRHENVEGPGNASALFCVDEEIVEEFLVKTTLESEDTVK